MLKIYNTLTRQKEEFVPRNDKKVNMFVCGPTVYDYSHIGHARTYIFYDSFAKYLRYKGFDVFYLQNITDIDDKIIDRAKKENKEPTAIAREYAEYYFEDMKSLNIDSVTKYAPATEYIPQIINQVKRLLERGCAYKIEEDGYYFDLSTDPEYGKLSGRTAEATGDAVSRIDENPNKRNQGDFCLWKFSKQDEPSWDFKTGKYLGLVDSTAAPAFTKVSAGRPGWHIEDTAITEANFGPQYDIHGGALELIFPHHEAEIAQMESISGQKPLVKYWIHTGLLTIDGKKMSKSAGNFITIRDALKKYPAEVVRFMILSRSYSSPLDFSWDSLEESKAGLENITEVLKRLNQIIDKFGNKDISEEIKSYEERFYSILENNFNTQEAFGILNGLISLIYQNINELNQVSHEKFANFINTINAIFNIIPKKEEISNKIKELVDKREEARKGNDFATADDLRKQIETLGYKIEDTSHGPLITKK